MKFKAFLFSLVISVGSFSYAENHVVSPEFHQDFKIAVKKIEDKKFLEAVEIFEKFTNARNQRSQTLSINQSKEIEKRTTNL